MKNLYIKIIDRIVRETGHDYDYVVEKFDERLRQDAAPVDILDAFLDGNM